MEVAGPGRRGRPRDADVSRLVVLLFWGRKKSFLQKFKQKTPLFHHLLFSLLSRKKQHKPNKPNKQKKQEHRLRGPGQGRDAAPVVRAGDGPRCHSDAPRLSARGRSASGGGSRSSAAAAAAAAAAPSWRQRARSSSALPAASVCGGAAERREEGAAREGAAAAAAAAAARKQQQQQRQQRRQHQSHPPSPLLTPSGLPDAPAPSARHLPLLRRAPDGARVQ